MQNEPNLRNAKMNVSYYKTTNYEEKCLSGQRKNEPKRTQFQSQRQGRYISTVRCPAEYCVVRIAWFRLLQSRSAKRDELQQLLKKRGINCVSRYPVVVHCQLAYNHDSNDMVQAEKAAKENHSLCILS